MSDDGTWIAVLGVVLSSASLAWQAATHALTGGRAKVVLLVGAVGHGGMVTAKPEEVTEAWRGHLTQQGYSRPIVAVKVANVGRQPVTVTRWSIRHSLGVSLVPVGDSIGVPLPHRLEVGESETWAVDIDHVLNLMKTAREVLGKKRPWPTSVRTAYRTGWRSGGGRFWVEAVVELADGRTRGSREILR